MKISKLLVSVVLLLITQHCFAHESRPVFLQLTEISNNHFMVVEKMPRGGLLKGKLYPVFPQTCQVKNQSPSRVFNHAKLANFFIDCQGGLRGKLVKFNDLDKNLGLSVLIQIKFLEGADFSHVLLPSSPSIVIPKLVSTMATFIAYTKLGIKHILLGLDHLLFILCLMMIVTNRKQLFFTITGFTIAHSITLCLAALTIFRLPSSYVELCIALSIVFLAAEIAKNQRQSLIYQKPAVIAFTFGLLHGFGFADVLLSFGLAQNQLVLSLLSFNLGVELGQLFFIVLCLLLVGLNKRLLSDKFSFINNQLIALIIGSVAAFWSFERLSVMIA